MTTQYIFDVWAPEGARWSPWVKPVLFACMKAEPAPWVQPPDEWDTSWAPPAAENIALVVDLPGSQGVIAGLALAERGYRPVPLYNALPMPSTTLDPVHQVALVEVRGIMEAIWRNTERLSRLALPPEAPPVFLLDAARRGDGHLPSPGAFDNRSVSFTTDFPSANFILARGLRRAVLVQAAGHVPQPDLAHTLRRWQEAGVAVDLKRLDAAGPPEPCQVPKPTWFGWVWQRVIVAFGLRRARAGGFGAWVPVASSG